MKAFRVKPQTAYAAPSYPQKSTLRRLASPSLMLSASLLMSAAAGCTVTVEEKNDNTTNNQNNVNNINNVNNTNNSVIDGFTQECTPGDLVCSENMVGECVDEDGIAQFRYKSCEEYCVDIFGFEALPMDQCSLDDTDNLCACEYDIIMGEMTLCEPGDLYCGDVDEVYLCNEATGDYESKTCDEYCQTVWGDGFYGTSDCDDVLRNNPCLCDYDMLDGFIAGCNPGEVMCINSNVVSECIEAPEGSDHIYSRCDILCEQTLGQGAISLGCTAEIIDDPCNCVIPE